MVSKYYTHQFMDNPLQVGFIVSNMGTCWANDEEMLFDPELAGRIEADYEPETIIEYVKQKYPEVNTGIHTKFIVLFGDVGTMYNLGNRLYVSLPSKEEL